MDAETGSTGRDDEVPLSASCPQRGRVRRRAARLRCAPAASLGSPTAAEGYRETVELLFFGAPGFMMLLGAAAAIRWVYTRFPKTGRETAGHTSTRLAAAGVEEITAFWYGSKRRELDQRGAQSMLRADHSDGAPPRDRIDLDRGRAVLIARPPGPAANS
ncbi:DUF6191 domain-containing protein [Nocardia carnea]|uniref:DUF6191 domain-containing protein n=1 Tax=Nocardia carnea TaxID=37328 RepID=UPI0024585C6D|nr:DUF6191 domain-containing protein [Nocardia carnea]